MSDPKTLQKVLDLMREIAKEQKSAADLSREQKKDVASMSHLFARSDQQLQRLAKSKEKAYQAALNNGRHELASKMEAEEELFRFILNKKRILGRAV